MVVCWWALCLAELSAAIALCRAVEIHIVAVQAKAILV